MMFSFSDFLKQADEVILKSELTDGWHKVKIESSEVKQTKSGTGAYLALRLRTDDNNLIYCNINLINPNQQAVQIGLGLLKALKLATAVVSSDSPQVFVGKTVEVLLKTTKGEQKVITFRNLVRPPSITKVVATDEPSTGEDIF
jgi:hypothetical protein